MTGVMVGVSLHIVDDEDKLNDMDRVVVDVLGLSRGSMLGGDNPMRGTGGGAATLSLLLTLTDEAYNVQHPLAVGVADPTDRHANT